MDNIKQTISDLYQKIKSKEEVKSLIPMGYVPGFPIIAVKNEQLVALVPFLRYKVTGEIDRTLVFPIRYVIEFLIPENQVVCFRDLSIEDFFAEQDFNKVIGFFRHSSIKNLDKQAYVALRKDTLSEYDKLVNSLLDDEFVFSADEEFKLKNNIQILVEPYVLEVYKYLNNDFYNKYLMK